MAYPIAMCLPMAAGTPGLLLTAAAAAKYFFRKEDKHLQIKWGYGDSEKFVEPENIHIEPLVAICTGMQREDIICLHSKTRFKVGSEHNEREPNPCYDWYPGYGNHKAPGQITLPAARCAEVSYRKFTQYGVAVVQPCIGGFHFFQYPDQKGDDMIVHKDINVFMAAIDAVPDPPEPKVEEDDEDDDEHVTWKTEMATRVTALEQEIQVLKAKVNGDTSSTSS